MNSKKLISIMLVFAFVAVSFAATANAKWIENTHFYQGCVDYDTVIRYPNGDISLVKDGVQVAFIDNVGDVFIVYDKDGAHICRDFRIHSKSGGGFVTPNHTVPRQAPPNSCFR